MSADSPQHQLKTSLATLQSPRAVELEIRRFCSESRLTPRETEVVVILAEGITKIKDIAERLSLSPNTINNHVNSIFVKTKTRSKSQLLAILLNRISEDLHLARLFRQRPRVLFVLRDGDRDLELKVKLDPSETLFKVKTVSKQSDLKYFAKVIQPHFVVYEMEPSESCIEAVRRLHSVTSAHLVFISDTSVSDEQKCLAMDQGAIDFLLGSAAPQLLAPLLIAQFIENDDERWRFVEDEVLPALEKKSDLGQAARFLRSDRTFSGFANGQMGSGGFFVPWAELVKIFSEPITSGDWVEFQIEVSPQLVGRVRGQVVWMRNPETNSSPPGAGIRVVALEGAAYDHLRSLRQSGSRGLQSLSYIPAG